MRVALIICMIILYNCTVVGLKTNTDSICICKFCHQPLSANFVSHGFRLDKNA